MINSLGAYSQLSKFTTPLGNFCWELTLLGHDTGGPYRELKSEHFLRCDNQARNQATLLGQFPSSYLYFIALKWLLLRSLSGNFMGTLNSVGQVCLSDHLLNFIRRDFHHQEEHLLLEQTAFWKRRMIYFCKPKSLHVFK